MQHIIVLGLYGLLHLNYWYIWINYYVSLAAKKGLAHQTTIEYSRIQSNISGISYRKWSDE